MEFDAHGYFEKEIRDRMRLTVEGGYKYSRVTSMQHLEDVIDNFRYEKAFFAVDDTEDGFTFRTGGGYMDRRAVVVYVLKKYEFGNMELQQAAMAECRRIYKNVLKKLIRDKAMLENNMVYLVADRVSYNEIPGYFVNGCAGLFFTVWVNVPSNLCFDYSEWL